MELKTNHASSDQNNLLFLFSMPLSCSVFVPHLLRFGETELFLLQVCPPKLCRSLQTLWLPASLVADVACWASASVLCDDRRLRRGETRQTHMALLAVGGQPEPYLNPWLVFISSHSPSLTVPVAFFHLGVFHRGSLLIRIIVPCRLSLSFGLRIRDQNLLSVARAPFALLPKYT